MVLKSTLACYRWREKHPENFKEVCKRYYLNHKEEIRERQRKHRQENRKWYRDYNKQYKKDNPLRFRLATIKKRCNNPNHTNFKHYGGRGIKCELTIENLEFLWNRDKANLMKKPQIDRIDNNGNYTLENCRFIEGYFNNSRMNQDKLLTLKQHNKFNKELRDYIKKNNMTLKDFSKLANIGKTSLIMWNSGKMLVKISTYERLKKLGIVK